MASVTGGTPWWGTLLATMVTACAAISGIAIATWRQNKRARREEWFRRLQWAEELRSSDDEFRATIGAAVLDSLASSDLASPDDLHLVEALGDSATFEATVEEIAIGCVDETDIVEDTENEHTEEVS